MPTGFSSPRSAGATRAVHTLMAEVQSVFWRAAAYHALREDITRTMAEAETALAQARKAEMENLKTPVEVLRYQKALLETMRQLTAMKQDLSTAVTELAALINVSPGTEIPPETPGELALPEWSIPLEQMEEEAFLNNPDLREQGYLARIAAIDTRKEIVKRLPEITFTVERRNDYNLFLADNHWYEAGARLSWNLLNLFSAPTALAHAQAGEDLTRARRLALRMGCPCANPYRHAAIPRPDRAVPTGGRAMGGGPAAGGDCRRANGQRCLESVGTSGDSRLDPGLPAAPFPGLCPGRTGFREDSNRTGTRSPVRCHPR